MYYNQISTQIYLIKKEFSEPHVLDIMDKQIEKESDMANSGQVGMDENKTPSPRAPKTPSSLTPKLSPCVDRHNDIFLETDSESQESADLNRPVSSLHMEQKYANIMDE